MCQVLLELFGSFWLLFGIYIKTFNVFCQKQSQANFARKFERCYCWSKVHFNFDFREKPTFNVLTYSKGSNKRPGRLWFFSQDVILDALIWSLDAYDFNQIFEQEFYFLFQFCWLYIIVFFFVCESFIYIVREREI